MKKVLLVAVPVLVILVALPMLGIVVITLAIQAAECGADADSTVPSTLGDLGDIEGPVGGTVKGSVTLAQANIPNRSGLGGFRASMPDVLSHDPDFVTLNEISGRSIGQIEGAARGYDAFRQAPTRGRGDSRSMGNAVLWQRDLWVKVNAGRVQIVDDDKTYYKGKPVTWDRFATWVMLQRKGGGAVVSVIATHQMTNPHKFPRQHGNPTLTRSQQYGAGMDILVQLTNSLAAHGPVLIGGDMNTQSAYTDLLWSAVSKMKAAGYGWANHSVDFVFFSQRQGARLADSWSGPMVSDHQWIAARVDMNGAGPTQASRYTSTFNAIEAGTATITGTPAEGAIGSSANGTSGDAVAYGAPAAGAVVTALMQLRFSETDPTLTAEQARNAITIAQVARDLRVPRYGLEVATATAIQESRLVNLDGGDRDSGGLFQQRPAAGWGSRAQVTNPTLATLAFFGRAPHTHNTGLLDIPGWEQMPLTEAAQAVQRSARPDAYDRWAQVATTIANLLMGAPLSSVTTDATDTAPCPTGAGGAITLATFNILGASHTDGRPGSGLGGHENTGWPPWNIRLPRAMNALTAAGVTIAGLQEVHPPQARALATTYASTWDMYPIGGRTPDKVVWDRDRWTMTQARRIKVPYFGGHDVDTPLVQLTSTGGQQIWVWSIHNPIGAKRYRVEALRRELATLRELKATGTPVVLLGDFNDASDGAQSSHCVLTPTTVDAFGGTANPCTPPHRGAAVDHLYGANLTWTNAAVDDSVRARRISDHRLVTAEAVIDAPAADAVAGAGTGPFVPSQVPYVGPYDPATLRSRMQTIINANGRANPDPFFGTEPDGSWFRDCQHFVAVLDGHPASGYPSAAAAWAHFRATGRAHPARGPGGMAPPVGAWLYYGENHVVVYLGDNIIAGTDTWGTGTARTGPASDLSHGPWHLPYLGWAPPFGA